MANYFGVHCPVCNEKFSSGDDIVVCPICGAPHHRECYKSLKQCAFHDDHLTGRIWQIPEEESPELRDHTPGTQDNKICPRCNAVNPTDGMFCHVCENRLNTPYSNLGIQRRSSPWMDFELEYDASYMIYGGVSPEEKLDGDITAGEMADLIGPSSGYYLPRFRNIEKEEKKGISINFSALIFNFFFFFYRKMYLIGFILLGLYLARMVPVFLYTKETLPLLISRMGMNEVLERVGVVLSQDVDMAKAGYYETLNRLAGYISLAVGFLVSLCANRFYYDKSVKTLRRVRSRFGGELSRENESYQFALSRAGGCNRWAVLALIIGVYALMCVVAFYMIIGG